MPKSPTNLDIDLVRTFTTIARYCSFTQAAQRLGRQQSTISLQIARLEAVLDTRLFERSPRSVRLTTEGLIFLEYAKKMLDLND
jgi:DNA-binding transcriptional LysR family regulator